MPPPRPAVPARRGTGRRGRGFSPSLPATGSGRRRRRARRLPGFPGDLSRLVEAALHVQRFGEHSGHGAQKSLFADGPKCLVRLLKVVPGRGRVSGDLLNMTGQACAQCPSGFRSRAVMHRPGAGDRVPGVSETADVRVDHRERYQDVGFRWLRLPRFETLDLPPPAQTALGQQQRGPASYRHWPFGCYSRHAACWVTQPREPRSTESSGALGVLERRGSRATAGSC